MGPWPRRIVATSRRRTPLASACPCTQRAGSKVSPPGVAPADHSDARRGRFADLPRRVYLTYRYRGFRAVLYQTLVFPLRLTPLDRVLFPVATTAGSEIVAVDVTVAAAEFSWVRFTVIV